jgi:DNA-binding NarL/FixJ family response regulator
MNSSNTLGAQAAEQHNVPYVLVLFVLPADDLEALHGGQGEPALSPAGAARVLKRFRSEASANSPWDATSPVTPHGEDPPCRLTAREVDVLRLIAKGYKVPEAAGMLGLSPHTVSSYVREIYRKLGISSRAEATLEAARRGLVR